MDNALEQKVWILDGPAWGWARWSLWVSSCSGSSVVRGFQEWLRTVGVVMLGEWEGERWSPYSLQLPEQGAWGRRCSSLLVVTEWLEAEPGRFRPVIRKRSFSERLFGKRAGGGEVVDAPYLSMCEASE